MITIHKQQLRITQEQEIFLPRGAKILSVGEQFNDVFVWYMCDPYAPTQSNAIYIFGTGLEIPDAVKNLTFIGTVLTDAGNYVWHVFE